MKIGNTALVLIGFQNDSFAQNGALHSHYSGELTIPRMLSRVLHVVERLRDTGILIVHAPIVFSPDYKEMPKNTVGLLSRIKEVGAYKNNTVGGETIPEMRIINGCIIPIIGKVGFNAFGNTNLSETLDENKVNNVVIMGVATSICIDSTGRAAAENGYNVIFLNDCHAGKSEEERIFYNTEIFPLYATVMDSETFIEEMT